MANDFINYPQEIRTNDPQKLALFERLNQRGIFDLLPSEIWWRDHQQVLQSRGFLLRPRFRPGWTPSWLGTNIDPRCCEDSVKNMHRKTMDATRMSDGTKVMLKKVPQGTAEFSIARYLTTPDRLQDSRNHCVPILNQFPDDSDAESMFIAMPVLREFCDPPFAFVREVVDFISQTLEGVVFLHDQGVAHRDLSDLNIMMDGDSLYPEGFHPMAQAVVPSAQRLAKYLRRKDVGPMKYYFTDFGISSRFENNTASRLVTGRDGQDQDVPELSNDVPYDPFPVDIFTLGNVYKRHFLNVYPNMSFIAPLVDAMTQRDPKGRPTAFEALSQFQKIVSRLRGSTLRWHLQKVTEPFSRRASEDILSTVREMFFVMKKIAGSPLFLATAFIAIPSSILSALYRRQPFFHRLHTVFRRSPSGPPQPSP